MEAERFKDEYINSAVGAINKDLERGRIEKSKVLKTCEAGNNVREIRHVHRFILRTYCPVRSPSTVKAIIENGEKDNLYAGHNPDPDKKLCYDISTLGDPVKARIKKNHLFREFKDQISEEDKKNLYRTFMDAKRNMNKPLLELIDFIEIRMEHDITKMVRINEESRVK